MLKISDNEKTGEILNEAISVDGTGQGGILQLI